MPSHFLRVSLLNRHMKIIFFTLINFAVAFYCSAQVDPKNEVDTTRTAYLQEMVVSANRIPEQRKWVAQQISILTPTIIQNLNAQSTADLISNSGVVAMQKSQQGGGSPILRGFEASRVLLVVDGVRLNNAIYRAGHLQNVITLDNTTLERAEILLGPSSTVYGSDALGGVIHFITRSPELSKNGLKFSGNAFIRYGSVNHEKASHVDVTLSGKRISSLTSFTFSDFGDLKMGKKINPALGESFGLRNTYVMRSMDNLSDVLVQNSDPLVQKFSGYQQWDFLQKIFYQSNERFSHTLNFQHSNSSAIPRYDRLTDPQGAGLRFAEWYYGPQQRLLTSYQLKVKDLGKWADSFSGTVSLQDVEESRYDRRFNNNNRNARIENIRVWGLTLDFLKKIKQGSFRYGIDAQWNDLNSTAYSTNIVTNIQSPQSTRYPDGDNIMNTFSVFATHTVPIHTQWAVTSGARIGISQLRSTFNDKTFFPFPFDAIEQTNTVGSANVGVVYTPSTWKLSLMASTGYRAPNIDDLAKVFESVAGTNTTVGTLIVPNPELKPEKTINADFAITKFFGHRFRLEGVLFATSFYDAIVTQPSIFNGQSTILYNGFQANVVSSQNAASAYLYGWSGSFTATLTDHLSIAASYNYTHGSVRNDNGPDTPLDHIAPAFGRGSVVYTQKKYRAEVFTNFSGWKYRSRYSTSGEDNLQYATPQGMPSWYTLNFRGSYELSKVFTVQVGLDNIFDLQYRTFASGIHAPGRNVFGTLRIKF